MAEKLYFDPQDFDESEVVAIRAKAKSFLLQGKTLMEWENEGTSSKKEFVAPIADILAACRTYFQETDPDRPKRITRTLAKVYSSS